MQGVELLKDGKIKKTAETITAVWGVYTSVSSVYKTMKERQKAKADESFYITRVPSSEGDLFAFLVDWMRDQAPHTEIRSVEGRLRWIRGKPHYVNVWANPIPVTHRTEDGHTIRVEYVEDIDSVPKGSSSSLLEDAAVPDSTVSSLKDFFGKYDPPKPGIKITAESYDGFQYVTRWLTGVAASLDNTKYTPKINVFRWGSWEVIRNASPRPLDSVVLPDGMMDDIVGDLSEFFASQDEYDRRAIPWHRAYLFHGPGGTGKTSIVKALASHFEIDLYILPLGQVSSDTDLLNYVATVGSSERRAILLLEDVDVFSAATEREGSDTKLTMSGLFNALDGVATPAGLVTVMTTNHPERLDPALVRPGRVDRKFEVTHLTQSQFEKIVHRFYSDTSLRVPTIKGEVSPAVVMEVLKRNLKDSGTAIAELEATLR